MTDSILRDKSKNFAKDIVFLCRKLKDNRVEGTLINQLLRSGTSVGANIHEAQYAQGTKDFISKFEIALKECNESVHHSVPHFFGYVFQHGKLGNPRIVYQNIDSTEFILAKGNGAAYIRLVCYVAFARIHAFALL